MKISGGFNSPCKTRACLAEWEMCRRLRKQDDLKFYHTEDPIKLMVGSPNTSRGKKSKGVLKQKILFDSVTCVN